MTQNPYDPMHYVGTYPPVKRAWREGDKIYFETGSFMLLTSQGKGQVVNSVWELPVDNPVVWTQEVEGDSFKIKASMKAPRLVSIEWKE